MGPRGRSEIPGREGRQCPETRRPSCLRTTSSCGPLASGNAKGSRGKSVAAGAAAPYAASAADDPAEAPSRESSSRSLAAFSVILGCQRRLELEPDRPGLEARGRGGIGRADRRPAPHDLGYLVEESIGAERTAEPALPSERADLQAASGTHGIRRGGERRSGTIADQVVYVKLEPAFSGADSPAPGAGFAQGQVAARAAVGASPDEDVGLALAALHAYHIFEYS